MRAARSIPLSCVVALSLASASAIADAPARLVVHQRAGRPLRVDGCTTQGRCSEWVAFAPQPPRAAIEARASRSGRFFYVWSKPDGSPRELDLFETPTANGPARRTAHLVPGAGGDLRWLEGDRLWHAWGCGTGCFGANLYTSAGKALSLSGTWEQVAPDGRRVAALDHGGAVTLVDAAHLTQATSAAVDGAGFPTAVTWTATGLRATFATLDGDGEIVRDCGARGAALACTVTRR